MHSNIWIDQEELALLPTSGPAWENVHAASARVRRPDLSNQDDNADVDILAGALVAARLRDYRLRDQVIDACEHAPGTEGGGRTLALGRNLIGITLAADIVNLPGDKFWTWLESALHEKFSGGPSTLIETHENRPNNWGTHAGATRVAVDWALVRHGLSVQRKRAIEDGRRAVRVWRGWLGDSSIYSDFEYGDLAWQADSAHPIGINPLGATRQGHSIDGVLPDDQRRAGAFAWPPPKENYVWEALQGVVAAMQIMSRSPLLGPQVWTWRDQAVLRAVKWLHEQCSFPASGDDEWQPHIINAAYGTKFPAKVPAKPGKNIGWTDWTHAVSAR